MMKTQAELDKKYFEERSKEYKIQRGIKNLDRRSWRGKVRHPNTYQVFNMTDEQIQFMETLGMEKTIKAVVKSKVFRNWKSGEVVMTKANVPTGKNNHNHMKRRYVWLYKMFKGYEDNFAMTPSYLKENFFFNSDTSKRIVKQLLDVNVISIVRCSGWLSYVLSDRIKIAKLFWGWK